MTPAQVIQEWAAKPFAYGADCCQFAGAMVEAIRGVNPMRAFRYSSERQALRLIARYGTLEAAVRATLGEPIPTASAVDGDVLLADQVDGSQIVGVCWKGRFVVRSIKTGLTDWPLVYARLAWRV